MQVGIPTIRSVTKSQPCCALGLAAVIAFLGLLWLGLDGGRVRQSGPPERRAMASTVVMAPLSYHGTRDQLVDLVPPTVGSVNIQPHALPVQRDNLAVLAWSSAGALTLVGLLLLAAHARRVRPASSDQSIFPAAIASR